MSATSKDRSVGAAADRRDPRVRVVAWGVAALAVVCAATVSPTGALWFAGAAALSWIAAPVVARLALRCGATVLPGGRSIHDAPTPLLGGLAIGVPVFVWLALRGGDGALGLAVGTGLMLLVGAIDDLCGLGPRAKIGGQVLAAFSLVAAGYGAPVLEVPPFGAIHLGGYEVVFVAFWVVLVTNAFNLIDGMDGLAATAAVVAALACALLGLSTGLALVLAGATLGFLRHNMPRARVFLGDAGSLTLGFLLAAFLLNGGGPMNVPLSLGVLALPLGDVAVSTLRTAIRGKPIFAGDRGHVHHRLLDLWGRPALVLAGLGAFAAVQAGVVALRPDLAGLAAVAALWGLALAYLLVKARPRWAAILLERRSFRRLHLVRQYAAGALRLAESARDVGSVLDRVAADLKLCTLRVGSLRFERAAPPGAVLVEEHVDCGRTSASWSAPFESSDRVLGEEKRTILCELIRLADARLATLEPVSAEAPAAAAAPPPVPPSHPRRPMVHFIADGRQRLQEISPFVEETRRRGTLEPVVVHTGRRDDLGVTDAQLKELGLVRPTVDLDVDAGPTIVQAARVLERYHALLDVQRPSVVVVGDAGAAFACALVAKERGIPVAQLGLVADAGSRPLGRTLTESLADLVLAPATRTRPSSRSADPQLVFLEDAPAEAAGVVPALEALLLASPGR